MSLVKKLTYHNDLGEAVLAENLIEWGLQTKRQFNATYVTWFCGNSEKKLEISDIYVKALPDLSGLICFEDKHTPDNCYVLDSEGKLLYRLYVPWELTDIEVSENSEMWFMRLASPPAEGEYGVAVYIEGMGALNYYYFELDYHKGKFLWGKGILY